MHGIFYFYFVCVVITDTIGCLIEEQSFLVILTKHHLRCFSSLCITSFNEFALKGFFGFLIHFLPICFML
jgi:hypothetical protein